MLGIPSMFGYLELMMENQSTIISAIMPADELAKGYRISDSPVRMPWYNTKLSIISCGCNIADL